MELEESTCLTSGSTTKQQSPRQYGTGTKTVDLESPEINPHAYAPGLFRLFEPYVFSTLQTTSSVDSTLKMPMDFSVLLFQAGSPEANT